MKINYDIKLKEELEKIGDSKPSLLLHVCCGPCSGNVIREIADKFKITIYYSNSNIYIMTLKEKMKKKWKILLSKF